MAAMPSVLEPFADGVWTVTRDLRFFGIETGSRMSIVRLPDERLFVHSPGPLDDELRSKVDAVGRVVAVVAPSKFHHLHVAQWQKAYPEAKLGCCPALVEKRADVRFDYVLGDAPAREWAGELDQVHFAARTMEDEVVFFHPRSRTLICCDAMFNLRHHRSPMTRLVALALWNRQPGATWLEHLMMRDRQSAREQLGRMLDWDIEGIILSHGPMVRSDGRNLLRRAYGWLL